MIGYDRSHAARLIVHDARTRAVTSFGRRSAMNAPRESEFRDMLQLLETCLETPRVSGELERWIAEAQRNVALIGTLLPKQIERQHAARLRQIAVEDPELNAEVERLKSGDDESREQFEK